MKITIDAAGRVVVPKALRDALGLVPGALLDVSCDGAALTLVPETRTARIVEEGDLLVAAGDRRVTDDEIFAQADAGRR